MIRSPIRSPLSSAIRSVFEPSLGDVPSFSVTPGNAASIGSFSRGTGAMQTNSDGTLTWVAAGVLRTADYSDSPTTPGIKIEPQATNEFANSSPALWTIDGISLTPNGGVDPSGGGAATLISAGTGSNRCYAFDNSGVTGLKMFSLFVSKGPGSLKIAPAGGQTSTTCTVDRTTGVVSGIAGAKTMSHGGYWRLSIPVNVTIASGNSTYWALVDPSSPCLVYGAQIEKGSVATSYIPTAGSAVTRGADVWTAPLSVLAGFSGAGTFLLVHKTPSGSPLLGQGGSAILTSSGDLKTALRFDGSASRISRRGGSISTGGGITLTQALGILQTSAAQAGGSLYSLDFYPRALPDARCDAWVAS